MKKPDKENQKGMFFDCFVFRPQPDLTEDELMNITVEVLRRVFLDPISEEPRSIPMDEPPAKRLLRLLAGIGISIETEIIDEFPEDIKRHFTYVDRQGTMLPYHQAKRHLKK